ncbi:uncharacterized protein BXZ73DRAFT_101927 [Epithele typhae]|uniref:uncharacterized protein n=1 Tax=Epithele typhae TaxID=378194 RepID=UPI00200896A6|nr:uncharacterized protein BXZ73DRAFT_101927 [Epithele typhae]KAH9929859.1 hypothetical protein BXZ73DRAFT_101927 [Epithele typhae]
MTLVEKPGTELYAIYADDVKAVHWFRTSGILTRWKEERKLLHWEMWRTIMFFAHWRRHWVTTADGHRKTRDRGREAYARKQADRCVVLLGECRVQYECLKLDDTAWAGALGLINPNDVD